MVIYEVNLTVQPSAKDDFLKWLPGHIKDLLQLSGFENAEWYQREPQDQETESQGLWTVCYHVKDRQVLQNYFDCHAEKFRQEALSRFEGQFTAARRIYLPKQSF